MTQRTAVNVLGQPLQVCGLDPVTGFFRDGCCNTSSEDLGSHSVCAQMTDDFLAFSLQCGNDLSTARPEFGFVGLSAGDKWCVCARRWVEALVAGVAPPILLAASHEDILDLVSLETLVAHALDFPQPPSIG